MTGLDAEWIALQWPGGRGFVPRGPRWVLSAVPVGPDEVLARCGRRPTGKNLWRIQMGGRFLASGGLVYPGGVPYPEELSGTTAVVADEVWLYVDEERGRILGMYTWPQAVRRPVAAQPRSGLGPVRELGPGDPRLEHPRWKVLGAAGDSGLCVLLVRGIVPEPLSELALQDFGGLTLRRRREAGPDLDRMAAAHNPPYTRVGPGIGREMGRTLGPQTSPWPAELLWWEDEMAWELKGQTELSTLDEVRRSIRR